MLKDKIAQYAPVNVKYDSGLLSEREKIVVEKLYKSCKVMDEIFLDVAHHLQRELGGEDAGVLALVLLEDVGLHRAAHR